MKKVVLISLSLLLLGLCGCEREQAPQAVPEIARMQAICELATTECYYHNVAKFEQKDAEQFLWLSRDKRFWVEYSGIVTIGVDASLVSLTVEGDRVTITMPPAEVQGAVVDPDSLNETSFIVAGNSAAITAEDQTEAFRQAQGKMEEAAKQDRALLAGAQQRAEKLLADYVANVGESVGRTYQIEWVYVDAEGNRLPDA